MKSWLSILLTAWWMVLGVQKSEAQYVTIPDASFVYYLQNFGYSACMSGDQMDTTCPTIVNATILECSLGGIMNLDGIQYFDNLQSLIINTNLTTWPTLPTSLTHLEILGSSLTAISSLPIGLTYLDCMSMYQCTSLPNLPSGLIYFRFANGIVTSLPPLPEGLTDLICWGNDLTTLPSLPSTLVYLHCNNNELTTLPLLPASLAELRCYNNQITTLPILPDDLYMLYYQDNPISSLPNVPSGLVYLNCSNTNMDSLPSALTTTCLNELTATNINLASLPPWPDCINDIDVSFNDLSSLPSFATTIAMSQGNLNLNCSNNQLSSLPVLPSSIYVLNCLNNPNLTCLPPISYVTNNLNIGGTAINCLPNYIQHPGSWLQIDTLPLCTAINPNNCLVSWNITGTVSKDTDGICQQLAEPPLQNIKVSLYNNDTLQQQVFTNSTGHFSFQTTIDTFNISIDTSYLPFAIYCPSVNQHTSIVSGASQFDTTANFELLCPATSYTDIAALSMSLHSGLLIIGHQFNSQFSAGMSSAQYGSVCSDSLVSGTLRIIIPSQLQYLYPLSNSLAPTQNVDTLVWDIADFSTINPVTDFRLRMRVDTSAQLGETVCITMIVSLNSGSDANAMNDTLVQCFVIGGSYDPNFKEVYPITVEQPGDWHTYTIHFQNTGTAAAQHILLKDTLDSNLDWSSFQLLAYSHENLTQVLQNGIVHFNFPNINLPDSTTDEPNSHGWIQYRIKTKSTITPGTTIHNTASIYFDFNTPVVTNDAVVNYCVPVTFEQTLEICDGDSVQVGNNWFHQPGSYTNAFTTSSGCDSTVLTNIVVDFIDTTLTVGNASIFANGIASAYQWIDCNTNQPINGETNQIFTPIQNGSYAVQFTFGNNCTTISSCVNVTTIGIESLHQGVFTLYPNPSNQTVTLTHPVLKNTSVTITDLAGRNIYTQILSDHSSTQLNVEQLSSGVYWVRVIENGKIISVNKLAVLQ